MLTSPTPDGAPTSEHAHQLPGNSAQRSCPEQLTEAVQRVEHLEAGLKNSRRIGMAIGIVMATHKITAEHAFAALSRVSQSTNRKLSAVADSVVFTGLFELPTPRDRSEGAAGDAAPS